MHRKPAFLDVLRNIVNSKFFSFYSNYIRVKIKLVVCLEFIIVKKKLNAARDIVERKAENGTIYY